MTKSTITRERMEEIRDCCWMDDLGLSMGELSELARMALAAMDSSESVELPLDYLQGHKDGLEWAAQLAEANHPETGDWLYDDPIELAKAIRKGPDMPPVQPVADSEPVAEITEDLGRLFVKIHYPTTLRAGDKLYRHAQPVPVVPASKKDPISFDEWSRKCALQITLCYPDFREKAKYIWDSARETQQPAPVVPDDAKLRELFDSWFASDCSFDLSPEASEADNIAWRESYWYVWQRCRAAMFAAAPQEDKP